MPKRRRRRALHASVALTVEEPNAPVIQGVTAADIEPDEDEAFRRMCAEWEKQRTLRAQRANQTITFARGPIALVDMADLHFGGSGVDYPRIFAEAQIVADTPQMYLLLDGDVCDNMIMAKLMHARLTSVASITDEWALLRRFLRIAAPKTLVAVAGNHDNWVEVLTGLNYFKDTVKAFAPGAIFDSDDVRFVLRVGAAEIPCRARHRWRGNSIYNLTHAIERGFLFDHDFRVGFGAHTHTSGLVRQFNASGETGIAVLAGTYKVVDAYSRRQGFPRANGSTASTVIVYEDGCLIGVDRLEKAAELMRMYHPAEAKEADRAGACASKAKRR